eukprot:scaffold43412_cov55-Phaeocystis_antarctica.AAC.2
MAWNPLQNYGWCSTAVGFVAARVSSGVIGQEDSANYCDASTSEASQGKGSQTSTCCVEHDNCLTCDPGDRGCTGSSKSGGTCDLELSTCAWDVSCSYRQRVGSWWTGYYYVWAYDFTCAAVSTLISGVMGNPVMLPNAGSTCSSTIPSAITCSGGSWQNEVGWSLSCSDGTTRSGGAPYTLSSPLAVVLGSTCTLSMTDSWGDGWNGNVWAAPGFGQSFSLANGGLGTKSFVVQ